MENTRDTERIGTTGVLALQSCAGIGYIGALYSSVLEIPGPRVQDGFSRFGTPLLLICSILIASIPFYQPSDSSRTVRNLLQRVIRVELYVVCFLWFRGDSSLRRVVTRVSLRPGLTPREDDVAFALSCFARATCVLC